MKILTSPSSFGKISNEPYEILMDNGFEIIKNPFGRKLTVDETIMLGKDCIGIVAGLENINSNVIDSIPNLKCISRVGVGMDNVDLNYAKSKGIQILNTPDGPTRAVSELTLGLTIAILRKISDADADLKKRIWKKQTGSLLFKKTIGILGLGRIGKMTAKIFKSLGNSVLAYDLNPDKEWAKKEGIEIVDFDKLLSYSDIITIHIPFKKNHPPLIGKNQFSKMKDGVFIVNVSRGGIVDEEELFKNLTLGKISSAAIDVFENEPYNGKLCDLKNVLLTPHIGSYAKEGKLKMEIDAVNNILKVLT